MYKPFFLRYRCLRVGGLIGTQNRRLRLAFPIPDSNQVLPCNFNPHLTPPPLTYRPFSTSTLRRGFSGAAPAQLATELSPDASLSGVESTATSNPERSRALKARTLAILHQIIRYTFIVLRSKTADKIKICSK